MVQSLQWIFEVRSMYVCITLFVYAYSLCWIFTIIIVYGTLNFVRTPKELTKIVDYLKSIFEMKDPGKQDIVLACILSIVQMTY